MSIEAGGAFSGKLESIDGLKLNNRAEIHIDILPLKGLSSAF